MERILTREEAEEIVRTIEVCESHSTLIPQHNTYGYLCPEIRVSKSGRIRVLITVPINPNDTDPLLRDCYSLREKFQDLDHFKRAYGV